MRGVSKNDVALHASQLVGDLLQDRQESQIRDHDAILRMVNDPSDLFWKKAWIDGVADRPDPHDAIPDFEMTPSVPGKGRDAVTKPDTVAIQPLRDLDRAVPDLPIVGAMNRSFDRSRNNLLAAVNNRRVLDDPV